MRDGAGADRRVRVVWMSAQWWSWVLSLVGVTGFWLAGKKVWWCWYINIANQLIWTAYAVVTRQWGFMIGVAVYMVVFVRNAVAWTREHRAEQAARAEKVS